MKTHSVVAIFVLALAGGCKKQKAADPEPTPQAGSADSTGSGGAEGSGQAAGGGSAAGTATVDPTLVERGGYLSAA